MLKAQRITWIQQKKTILRGIDLEIQKGECVGLIGPNGSGKSSLLKILAFLEPPTAGSIRFNNRELRHDITLETRRKIAIVFQEPLLFNTTVYHNVAAGLKIRRLPKTIVTQTAAYWLDAFGITHIAKQHVSSLSGGEAQRVSLARAFATNPEVLFLDEPFSSLDAPTTEELLTDLNRVFQSTGVTTLIVSHNFREIQRLTNRIYVMQNGEIKATGFTAELLARSQNKEDQVFLAPWS